MGSSSSVCYVTNYSKRNIRVFVTKQPLGLDDVLTSEFKRDEHDASRLEETLSFKKGAIGVRMAASRSHAVKYEPQQYMNLFVEDDNHKDVCSKHIMCNMTKSAAFSVLLYDA